MSQRYKGGVISATPPTTSTSSASGVWTEQQFMQGVASGSWPALAGAPTIGTATAGALSASVTFTAPTYTGSGITGYTVTSNPGNITGTGASSPVTVSGLTAGTSYTFTVTATTAAGQSTASAASNSVTPFAPVYIEEIFSAYLYTSTGSNQTITNNINLSGNGGLVWVKGRNAVKDNVWVDTVRGVSNSIVSNTSNANDYSAGNYVNAFDTTGFGVGGIGAVGGGGNTFATWTFREQPKFFDVVPYTGDGIAGRTVAHNLGSAPGFFVIKRTDSTGDWRAYHRSLGANKFIYLNADLEAFTSTDIWNNTAPTSTVFTLGNANSQNISGASYIAYLFAHDAGGFGLTGSDNVVSCGSFTCDISGVNINLGYEPQWVMLKATDNSGLGWVIWDNMRGFVATTSGGKALQANSSTTESNTNWISPTSTGFRLNPSQVSTGVPMIYIAVRRGPMAAPTTGTSVFQNVSFTSTASRQTMGSLPVVDMFFGKRTNSLTNWGNAARLISSYMLKPNLALAQDTNVTGYGDSVLFDLQNGSSMVSSGSGDPFMTYNVKRAPGFFDVVCWTGDGTYGRLLNHNLGVVPEMVIFKSLSNEVNWVVWQTDLGGTYPSGRNYLYLNTTDSVQTSFQPMEGAPTSTQLNLRPSSAGNANGYTYIAYLFASCPGVSKVGGYTGNGAVNRVIDCGFTSGARFIMLKKTSTTSDWYIYDTARGISTDGEKSLSINTTAAESGTQDVIDPASSGFSVGTGASDFFNESGVSYIFLAIA